MKTSDLDFSRLSRRTFFIGSAGLLTLTRGMAKTPACSLMAEQEEGPYYLDYSVLRQDITEGKKGVPLKLRLQIVDARRCEPLPDAAVDIWHCDASGVYSGFTAQGGGLGGPGGPPPDGFRGPGGPPPPDGFRAGPGFGGPGPGGPGFGGPGGPHARSTDATRYLRGVQLTDSKGIVEFSTLYPGWYQGRAIHIHTKVRLGGKVGGEKYQGGNVSHTGQVFFPEDLTEQIAKLEPYAQRLNVHRTTQEEDHVYTEQHGDSGLADLTRLKKGSNTEGFVATLQVAVDPDATPSIISPGWGGPDRARGRS